MGLSDDMNDVKQFLIGISIHLLVPIAGLLGYFRLLAKMKLGNLKPLPSLELFLIFLTYGGCLIVALTTFFWEWSGMASIGVFYLILLAPILMGAIAKRMSKVRNVSTYHQVIYWASLTYLLLVYLVVVPLVVIMNLRR